MERNLHQLEDPVMFERLSRYLNKNWQSILTYMPNLEKHINKQELENNIRQSMHNNESPGKVLLLRLGTRCFKLKDLFEAFRIANFNEGISIVLNRPIQVQSSLKLSSSSSSIPLNADISTELICANEGKLVKLIVTTSEKDNRLLRYQWFKENINNHQLEPVKSTTFTCSTFLIHPPSN